jgi:hypothetical protein
MKDMATDVIPAGDRGEYRITDQMLYETGATTWAAFEVLLKEEARARGLDVEMLIERPSRDVIIRWAPAREPVQE